MSGMVLVLHGALASDIEVVPEAQVRPRWEADSGRDGVPDEGDVSFVSVRSRLGATLRREELAVRVVVGDVRLWGEELDTRRDFDANGLDVPIATLTWSPGPWAVQIGRMQESLHEERLLAVANWRQPGRSFDGARVTWSEGAARVEARALLVREGDVLDASTTDQAIPGTRDQLLFLVSGGRATDALQVLPLALLQTGPDLTRWTVGVFGQGSAGIVHGTVEAYGQSGEVAAAPILAGMIGGRIGIRPDWKGDPGIALGTDLLSGDGSPGSGRNTAFHTVYGANHRYYGTLDMATFVVGGARDGRGLSDTVLHGDVGLGPSGRLDLDLHALLGVLDGELLAIEPDLQVRLDLTPGLILSAGVSLWVAPDPAARESWGWVMLDARL